MTIKYHLYVTSHTIQAMALPTTSKSILHALQNLSQQTNKHAREALLKAGLKEILKWFSLAAQNIIEDKIKLPKQTAAYISKHKEDVRKLTDPLISEDDKRRIILKPGGGGFLGGVIIRSLLRWNGDKTSRTFGSKQKASPKRKTTKPRAKQQKKPKSNHQKKPKTQRKRRSPKIQINERFITQRRRSKPISPPGQQYYISHSNNAPLVTPRKSKSPRKQALIKRFKDIGDTFQRYMTPRKLHFEDIPSTSLSPRSNHEYHMGKKLMEELQRDGRQYKKLKKDANISSPSYNAVRVSPNSVYRIAAFSPLNETRISEPAQIALRALYSQFS